MKKFIKKMKKKLAFFCHLLYNDDRAKEQQEKAGDLAEKK